MKNLGFLLAIAVILLLAAVCGPAPTPEVVTETVVVAAKETVIVTQEVPVEVPATEPPEQAAPEGPSGTVRFLIAENFWADWDPYQTTAQSRCGSKGRSLIT